MMKLHLPQKLHLPHWHDHGHHLPHSQAHDDLLYGTALILGIPVVVIGARWVIEAIFSLWS